MNIALTLASALALPLSWRSAPDAVVSLPTFGAVKVPQYAGFAAATADGQNRLHYWFAACDCGSTSSKTPLLLWLNGGPGASSLTGLLAERLGPQSINKNATLSDNPFRITKKYHLLAVDNPVGSGYSTTADGGYVRSEYEVRTQFVHALRHFLRAHPEYKDNPLWVMGESCNLRGGSNAGAAARPCSRLLASLAARWFEPCCGKTLGTTCPTSRGRLP